MVTKSKLTVTQPMSDGKAVAILTRADKEGREAGDRMGKYLRDTKRKPNAEALLTAIRVRGVQSFDRMPVA